MPSVGFRSFSPPLQRFFVATVANMIGSAALFAFALVYLHDVRGISLGRAGFAVGAMSFVMVLTTPLGGALTDRFGPKPILMVGCVLSIAAASSFAFVSTFVEAVLASSLLGIANALWFPSQSALLALIVTPAERPAVSAFQRAALNLGAALGAVIGGLIVRSETLTSYRWLIALDVATYVVFLCVLPSMPAGTIEGVETSESSAGYKAVLRDSFFMKLLMTDIAIAMGFGFLWAFTPAYASEIGIGNATIGILFGLGAASIVVTQIATLRWARGGNRMNWLALMNLWFVGAFTVMLVTPHVSLALAVAGIGVAQVLGGFGEAVLGAVRTPLTSDLAPEDLMGRYHGLATMVFQICMGLANVIGGLVMQHSLSLVWAIPLALSIAGVLGTVRIRHRIPAHLVYSA